VGDPLAIFGYWLHLGAAVFWIGGIAFILLIAIPASKSVPGNDSGLIMGEIAGRFGPLANWCILLLIVTGILMTGLAARYSGVMHQDNNWTIVLLVKLALVSAMVGIHFFRGLVLGRMIARVESGAGKSSLQKLSLNLVKVNLALGSAILLLSGALSYLS